MVEMSLRCILHFCFPFSSLFYSALFFSVSSPSLTNITLPHAHKIKYFYSKTITAPITFNTLLPLYRVFMARRWLHFYQTNKKRGQERGRKGVVIMGLTAFTGAYHLLETSMPFPFLPFPAAMAESMQHQTLITTRLDLQPRTAWALWWV